MDVLVIAPTATFRRKRNEVNDVIKDSPNAVNVEQKIGQVLPYHDRNARGTESKVYADMRMITKLHQDLRKKYVDYFVRDQIFEKNPMFRVSFPEMDVENIKLIRDQESL